MLSIEMQIIKKTKQALAVEEKVHLSLISYREKKIYLFNLDG